MSEGSGGCAFCEKPRASQKCGSCKAVSYCNATCQKQDWKKHKPSCQIMSAFSPYREQRKESKDYLRGDDGSPHEKLVHAVNMGDKSAVATLLEEGANPNRTSAAALSGSAALGLASFKGFTGIARLLISAGAEVNKVDSAKNVPLLYAAQNQHLEIVELLIQHRAVLGATNTTGASALTLAAQTGNVPIMNALLAAGADPHHLDANGLNVLSSAATSCCVEAVRLLLSRSANVNLQCRTSGDFPLRCAAASGKNVMPAVGIVMPGTRVDDEAAAETVRELLSAGALVNMARKDGATALIFSAQNGNALVTRMLMDAGADANQASIKGVTPLCGAAGQGRTAVVNVLLQRADVNKTTEDGRSPLYLAAEAGHVDVCKVLLSHSADPNLATNTGSTALMMASQNARVEAVRLLIEAGANVNQKAHNTGTAFMCSFVDARGGRVASGLPPLVPAMSLESEQAALRQIGIMLLEAGAERIPLR